jgi:hypothetical protein
MNQWPNKRTSEQYYYPTTILSIEEKGFGHNRLAMKGH